MLEELAVAGEILGAEAGVAAFADTSLDERRADKEGDADEEEGGDEPVDDEAGDDAFLINGVHEAGHEDPCGDGAGDDRCALCHLDPQRDSRVRLGRWR